MKTGTKIILGVLTAGAIGGGYLFLNRRKKAAAEAEQSVIPTEPTPNVPATPKHNTAKPAALSYDSKFTKADKAHVAIMQKMIGVEPDGAWGSKTDAALPRNLARPFSLNQLQQAINALKTSQTQDTNIKKSGLKVGDLVYAAYTTDVEISENAKYKDLKWTSSKEKRKQEVQKGQYLGKVVVLNPYTVLILNNYDELVLANYPKVTKQRLNGLGNPQSLQLL